MRTLHLHIALILISCFFAINAYGHDNHDHTHITFDRLAALPVLDEGRIKSIQSFANYRKNRYSGNQHNAVQWLADTVFTPEKAIQYKTFEIRSHILKEKLGLNTNQSHFSYIELLPGIQNTQSLVENILANPPETISDEETTLLTLHDHILGYENLLRTFSALMPITINDEEKTYSDLAPQSPEALTLAQGGANSLDFKILPSSWDKESENWLSPWESILSGQGSPQSAKLLSHWDTLIDAYNKQDAQAWDQAIKDIHTETYAQAPQISSTRLWAENTYKDIRPYIWVIALYAFAIIATLIKRPKTAPDLTLIAIAIHLTAILTRIYILDRPPVGTLYESVLFVALICAAGGLLIQKWKAEPHLLITGNLSAIGLLLYAPFLLQGQDSLEVLVAVLNTSFWLATHVLIITIGYGLCIIAAMLAHYMLVNRCIYGKTQLWNTYFKLLHTVTLAALLFTTVGTILGGIWADQSWGRFWGWDPKENGALLIVLWLIWIQHGRLSGHLKPLGFTCLAAGLNIIVALAWFGVNLLSVGLHSYGFIDGIAQGLLIFCILEICLIASLTILARRKTA